MEPVCSSAPQDKTIDEPPPNNDFQRNKRAALQEGWVIANHILVSFHVAFISSVLSLPSGSIIKNEVLRFIFFSPETLVSALFMFVSFHAGIAVHELGHYLTAARLNALNDKSQREALLVLQGSFLRRAAAMVRLFILAPYGKASGIKREGLNYYPDAPYNLAVAAAGPRTSRNLAIVILAPAVVFLVAGVGFGLNWATYMGRLCLGIGIIGLLDFLLADAGKYREFRVRERQAKDKAAGVERSSWWATVAEAKHKMLSGRMQTLVHPRLGPVAAPWQFRNCGMGGRHTEKEYPESNISMQEAMFLILGAHDYQEAQEMTIRLQNRLKEIIEKEEGCRVMGIGLEGGLAPYIERGVFPLPEVRLWAMMKQTIEECGYRPGADVAIALDPAMSELEIAYRKLFNMPDSVGMYLFWREKTQMVMDRDGVLALYLKAVREYDIPLLSIEDGFSEHDYQGWQQLLGALGDRVLVIGDDLVTTNDRTIELAAAKGLINTVLIKANQIGTLYETILAMLVSLGKGLEIVVSHRSKSPNDDMEAQIALAVNALGLKAGGGANTERLVKYHAVTELMQRGMEDLAPGHWESSPDALVRKVFAYEEPTNAGVPSVGTTVELELPEQRVFLKFKGATPLGTSAGSGEAIHLVDAIIESSEHREVVEQHAACFKAVEPGVFRFSSKITEQQVVKAGDDDLASLFRRAQRYGGKGCLNAVDNVSTVIAPVFEGVAVSTLSLKAIDQTLLSLELRVARRRGKLAEGASPDERILVMQRKQNLGMNAVLSVSLALARAVAHLQGKALFEIIREEMFAIIQRLAAMQKVQIKGSRFSDYVQALREVNQVLEEEGSSLYRTLREITGIYQDRGAAEKPQRDHTANGKRIDEDAGAKTHGEEPLQDAIKAVATVQSAQPGDSMLFRLSEDEKREIVGLNQAFFEVFAREADQGKREEVLRRYVFIKDKVSRHLVQFGLVNNRVYMGLDGMLIPYILGNTLYLYRIVDGMPESVWTQQVRGGLILTDGFVKGLAKFEGETVDLEDELFELNKDRCGHVRIVYIRDMAELLQRISRSANEANATYLLRILVARLSLFTFKKYLSAKNIQTEVRSLISELMAFLKESLSYRLPFLVRILVRNISGVVTKPKVIDRLWNDTIDLAEVHLRGSDIVNEIRRSTHHAVGKRTLTLVRSYLEYLESGDSKILTRLGYSEPGPADEEARRKELPKQIVARVLGDLEELLGNADVLGRIQEWQSRYASTLTLCESEKSLSEEMDKVVAECMKRGNRWTFYHHLRIIKNRVIQFPLLRECRSKAVQRLDALQQQKPDVSGFDASSAENDLRCCVEDFIEEIRSAYQKEIFERLEQITFLFRRGEYFATFSAISDLRKDLRTGLREQAFPEQRLLLYELDCLLEEMGYVALRHVASDYEEKGVDLTECLQIIRRCALNLSHDGLYSRQLLDLVGILSDDASTYPELADILRQIQRNYQQILRQLVTPFQRMQTKLELDEEELRIALANMQRFLHDLNSMVFFADTAVSCIEQRTQEAFERVESLTAEKNADGGPGEIVHLSHHEVIRDLVLDQGPVRNVLAAYGGKGSGLIYINYLNIPTTEGFIMPTSMARRCSREGDDGWLEEAVHANLKILEGDIVKYQGRDRGFGRVDRPLLLAVRGGSVFSMPGILTTVLFVGMNDHIVEAMARDDPWHAYDSYRRFLGSYGQAVWGVDLERFNLVEEAKDKYRVKYKYALPWEAMRDVAEATKSILCREGYGVELEEALNNPRQQLLSSVRAVINSWNHQTAVRYRRLKGISDSWHTAVIVQEMAMGNRRNLDVRMGMDESGASLTGVIPRSVVTELGVSECTGDFKFSASGDDLVGGLTRSVSFFPLEKLGFYMPMLDRRLRHTAARLTRFMGADQEIEFTVDRGVLSVLQTRAAEVGINKVSYAFQNPGEEITRGIGVRGSAFRGLAAFDEADYQELKAVHGTADEVIDGILMVLENPTPGDIPMVLSAEGLLAAKGGSTSHAAIAINGIEHKEFTAVVSAEGLRVNAREHEAVIVNEQGDVQARIRKGDMVSIHGSTGAIFIGTRPLARV
ncbi:MAG TPA: hypothetical protein ENN39_07190 [Desulfonatronum sp.]|nr:hypothetical protein [Desulfonatronum sp.]